MYYYITSMTEIDARINDSILILIMSNCLQVVNMKFNKPATVQYYSKKTLFMNKHILSFQVKATIKT